MEMLVKIPGISALLTSTVINTKITEIPDVSKLQKLEMLGIRYLMLGFSQENRL